MSDDDQMVICEDPQPEIDLKCKDKLVDSDNEGQDEDSEKKNVQIYSNASGGQNTEGGQGVKPDVTCRPKPIKGKEQSERILSYEENQKSTIWRNIIAARLPSTSIETTAKYHHASMDKGDTVSVLSTTYPYHSPVNPTGVSGFQPTGGAFITMPISPKIIKPEAVKSEQQYSTQYTVNNLVAGVHPENGRNKFTAAPVLHSVSYLSFNYIGSE